MSPPISSQPLLDVQGLSVSFPTRDGLARVVRDVSWQVARGETVAVVGESGSGKSVSMLALTGLLPAPPARIGGQARFDGIDLIGADRETLRALRGDRIGMVFQDPMTSLNPYLRVGRQVVEGLQAHRSQSTLSRRAAHERAVELLAMVGIPEPRRRVDDYPHEFSGGMRQRVMIATALACDPDLLVADEATTALDVTTQAQIVELVGELQSRLGMAVIWISHDLGVVARIAHRVVVMYAGQVVEEAPVDALFADTRHPYSAGLLRALPVLEPAGPVARTASATTDRAELLTIEGLPPDPRRLPPGCAFYPRCPHRLDERCATEPPPLREVVPGHFIRSFYSEPKPAIDRDGSGG
ncbi:MAG TPA: ABC transporter ATP-binding protein [Kineosporiaceae bacterium]|nr:ABC transporter ATP-binding protein [Kineosporiaceae bacterium]